MLNSITISQRLGTKDIALGGPGSGNWAHAGRPGQIGGSQPRSSAMSVKSGKNWEKRYRQASEQGKAAKQESTEQEQRVAELKKKLIPGKDAAFKRGKDGMYRSENGMMVGFKKYGSSLYAWLYHAASGSQVWGYTSAPVKSVKVVLEAARKIGAQINFNASYDDFEALSSIDTNGEIGRQMRSIIYEASKDVYK